MPPEKMDPVCPNGSTFRMNSVPRMTPRNPTITNGKNACGFPNLDESVRRNVLKRLQVAGKINQQRRGRENHAALKSAARRELPVSNDVQPVCHQRPDQSDGDHLYGIARLRRLSVLQFVAEASSLFFSFFCLRSSVPSPITERNRMLSSPRVSDCRGNRSSLRSRRR